MSLVSALSEVLTDLENAVETLRAIESGVAKPRESLTNEQNRLKKDILGLVMKAIPSVQGAHDLAEKLGKKEAD
jgi:hypothetical protein